jgi:hypothetical protein
MKLEEVEGQAQKDVSNVEAVIASETEDDDTDENKEKGVIHEHNEAVYKNCLVPVIVVVGSS